MNNPLTRGILKDILTASTTSSDIIILLGSRQVGKTTLMRLVEQELAKNTPGLQHVFLDAEDSITRTRLNEIGLDRLVPWLQAMGFSQNSPNILFIDEVQYLDQPASLLKLLHDHTPWVKLIVSGSSTLEIKNKLQDSLMGRKRIFPIYTLTFAEYASFKNIPYPELVAKPLTALLSDWNTAMPILSESQERLFPWWENYVVEGGFPRVALSASREEAERYLRELRTSFITRDILEYHRFLEGRDLGNLLTILAERVGNLTNEAELAGTLGISKVTVRRYIWLLEQTFALFSLTPFFTNKRSELSKMPKTYFYDTGWRTSWLNGTLGTLADRGDRGSLVENAVTLGMLKKLSSDRGEELHFWRSTTDQEVDLVLSNGTKSLLPIEIKYHLAAPRDVPRGMKAFFSKYPDVRQGVIITKNTFDHYTTAEGHEIFCVPAWVCT